MTCFYFSPGHDMPWQPLAAVNSSRFHFHRLQIQAKDPDREELTCHPESVFSVPSCCFACHGLFFCAFSWISPENAARDCAWRYDAGTWRVHPYRSLRPGDGCQGVLLSTPSFNGPERFLSNPHSFVRRDRVVLG